MKKKKGLNIIPITGNDQTIDIANDEKIPLAKCREILCSKGAKYTDEQIIKIRNFMYLIAGITFDEYSNSQNRAIIIPFSENKIDNEHEESYYLRAS